MEQHLPTWLARFLHWLRQPSMLAVRVLVCLVLIAGGILSFLPILGFWMLPLGLMIIAQDLPFLQRKIDLLMTRGVTNRPQYGGLWGQMLRKIPDFINTPGPFHNEICMIDRDGDGMLRQLHNIEKSKLAVIPGEAIVNNFRDLYL